VEHAEYKGEGEGEGEEEEQWLVVETLEVDGELRELLSIVLSCALFLFFFFGQWRMQKTKEKGKRKSSGWRWKQRRSVVSYSPLFT
jgi:hypothetical protein